MSLTGKALKQVDRFMQKDFSLFRRRRTLEWFDRVLAVDQDESLRPEGIMGQMYCCICAFCDDILNHFAEPGAQATAPMSKSAYRLMDGIFDSLVEWGDEFKVYNGSLDDALKDSQDLRHFSIRIMIRICETLTNDLLPVAVQVLKLVIPTPQVPEHLEPLQLKAREIKSIRDEASLHAQSLSESDDKPVWPERKDGSESPAVHSDDSAVLEDVLETLKSDVDALVELGPLFEEPIRDTLVTEKPAAPPMVAVDDGKYQPFLDGIRQKYPECDLSLARALSKALYDNTMRLHVARQTAAIHETAGKPGPMVGLPKDSGYETSLKEASQVSNSQRDNSIAAGSSYARTLASYDDADDGTTRTPFPSQPKDIKTGEEFPCIACGRQVAKSERGSAWRRHLLSDLRPWICCQVSCHCARVPYRTRNEWERHLQAQHEVHPNWNDKKCPFCPRVIAAGGREMMRHVERHLRQLSLAALPANPGNDSGDSESEHESDTLMQSTDIVGGELQSNTQEPAGTESLEDHPLYSAVQEGDGLWHCPWEGEGYCDHKPSVLRADFDKFLRVHLESLRCKIQGCSMAGRAFATQEILYLHEQKEHDMHKGGGRYLCTSPGCGRSRPGNGFASKWVQLEHIKSVHENIPDLPPPPEDS